MVDGAPADALAALARLEATVDAVAGRDHPAWAVVQLLRARAHAHLGELAAAATAVEAAMSCATAVLGPDHPELAEALAVASDIALTRGEAVRARALAERGMALVDAGHVTPWVAAAVELAAAEAMVATDATELDRARALAQRAAAIRVPESARAERLRARAERWLAQHAPAGQPMSP
jgi:hypothetical protein